MQSLTKIIDAALIVITFSMNTHKIFEKTQTIKKSTDKTWRNTYKRYKNTFIIYIIQTNIIFKNNT